MHYVRLILALLAWGNAGWGAEWSDPLIATIQSEACFRATQALAGASAEEKAREVFTLLTHLRKISEDPAIEASVEKAVIARFAKAIEEGREIDLYIPCFPAKSPNHVGKTLGTFPDLAERIAIARLQSVVEAMNQIHKTRLVIASDGRMFADTWWTTDKKVDEYREGLREMITTPQMQVMDLSGYFPGLTPQQAREKIMADYAPTAEQVRESIEKDPQRKALYLAFTKFIEGDTPPDDPALVGLSNNAKTRLYKQRAIEDMRRSDALNIFLQKHFVDEHGYIRLSIRDSVDTPDKIGINLLDAQEGEFTASPWHSVIVVYPSGKYKAMKRYEAEREGHKLVYVNGRPDHFEAAQDIQR